MVATRRRGRGTIPMVLAACACLCAGAGSTRADTLTVPGEYPTIQDAIDAAMNGDIVLVSSGTYGESIDFLGKMITVESVSGASTTVINANGTGQPAVRFDTFEGANSVLRGFRITNGTGVTITVGLESPTVGAGIFIDDASPTIDACIVQGNSADRGGGFFARDGAPVITDTTFRVNSAEQIGGGAWLLDCDAMFDGCTFDTNSTSAAGSHGGGIGTSGGLPSFVDCQFSNNTTIGSGGGAYVINTAGTFGQCIFYNNTAEFDGGGMWINGPAWPVMSRTSFLSNTANAGGGVHVQFSAAGGARSDRGATDTKFINCQFIENTGLAEDVIGSTGIGGGAIAAGVNARLDATNCTIFSNHLTGAEARGGGVAVTSMALEVRITNSIVWGNTAVLAADILEEQIRVTPAGNPALNVTFTCIQDGNPNDASIGFGGAANNNIDDFPNFNDPGGIDNVLGTEDDNLMLTEESPCLDVGDSAAPDLPAVDLAGEDRISQGVVDMGCYEFHPPCRGDADDDLDVDLADLLAVLSAWGTSEPGPDVDDDGVVGLPDLLQVLSNWGTMCEP